jgi:hypothetical protein
MNENVVTNDIATGLKDFTSDLNNLLDSLLKNQLEDININFKLIEDFKTKYSLEIDSKLIKEVEGFEKDLIKTLIAHNDKWNNKEAFFTAMLDLIDLLMKFYIKEEFFYNTKLSEFYATDSQDMNGLQLLYLNIGKKAVKRELDLTISESLATKPLNEFLDILLLNLFKYVDIKIIFITTNILPNIYRNKNAFLAFKLITFNLLIFHKITSKHKFFNTVLTNIIKLLQPEGNAYCKRMNDELYNNAFADFDYNVESSVRKLNNEEFNFLINIFFLGIINIVQVLTVDISSCDLTDIESRKILFETIDDSIEEKKGVVSEDNGDVYRGYLMLCFLSDIFEFIFSNLHYLDASFNEKEDIEMNENPFLVYNEKMIPRCYDDFLKISEDVILRICPDVHMAVKIFLTVNEVKSKHNEKIQNIESQNDYLYYIFEPFNNIGFSIICWLQWKRGKSIFPYSNLYIFDSMLPIIAALIKRGQNFKYIGFEMLLDLVDKIGHETITNLRLLKNYSFVDLLKDILEFVGGPDHQIKRAYMNKQFMKLLRILSPAAIKETYQLLFKDLLLEGSIVNDGLAAYAIHTLKALLNDYIGRACLNPVLFDSKFIKDILNTTLTDKFFVIDVLETINYGINLLHYLMVKDKLVFKGSLGLYNKDYMHEISKKIKRLAGHIEKWVISPDEDKRQFVNLETMPEAVSNLTRKREEFDANLQARKVQAELTLSMVNNIESLIDNYLKLI